MAVAATAAAEEEPITAAKRLKMEREALLADTTKSVSQRRKQVLQSIHGKPDKILTTNEDADNGEDEEKQ